MKLQHKLISSLLLTMALFGTQLSSAAHIDWKAPADRAPQIVIENPSPISTNFTCDSGTHSCTCQGTTDCFDLGNSGLCKEGTIKPDGSKYETLVCDFKF